MKYKHAAVRVSIFDLRSVTVVGVYKYRWVV